MTGSGGDKGSGRGKAEHERSGEDKSLGGPQCSSCKGGRCHGSTTPDAALSRQVARAGHRPPTFRWVQQNTESSVIRAGQSWLCVSGKDIRVEALSEGHS